MSDYPFGKLEKPVPPDDSECCQSGCGEYCVFELYLDELRAYNEQQKAIQNQDDKQ